MRLGEDNIKNLDKNGEDHTLLEATKIKEENEGNDFINVWEENSQHPLRNEGENTKNQHADYLGYCGGNIYTTVNIQGKFKLAMIDTGSNRNILSYTLFLSLKDLTLRKYDTSLVTATGSPIKVHGIIDELTVEIGGKNAS